MFHQASLGSLYTKMPADIRCLHRMFCDRKIKVACCRIVIRFVDLHRRCISAYQITAMHRASTAIRNDRNLSSRESNSRTDARLRLRRIRFIRVYHDSKSFESRAQIRRVRASREMIRCSAYFDESSNECSTKDLAYVERALIHRRLWSITIQIKYGAIRTRR